MRWQCVAVVLVGIASTVLSQEDGEASLDIMARSTPYEVGDTKAIFCKLFNLEDGDWYNPSGEVVGTRSAKNKRIFVEKKKEGSGLLMPLIINKMEISDSGNWTCMSGDLEETIHILIGRKVVMDNAKEIKYGHEGKTSRLDCEPDGYPEPVVQWYKDRLPIDEHNKKYIVHTKGRNRQLEIKNANHMDAGEYVCKVTQKLLSHYTDKTITFIVNHSPVIVDPETQEENTASTEEVFTLLDRVKNLTCNAVAYPLPDFKWNKHRNGYDGDEIKDDTVVNSDDGLSSVLQLRVFNESYLGQYKCTASNPHGHRSIVFDVRLGNKPNPPDVFSVVGSNSSSITFNLSCSTCVLGRPDEGYSNPQNLTVTGYKIQLTLKPKTATPDNWDEVQEFQFEIEDVDNTLFSATNLTSETAYHARACSLNEAGESEWFELEGDAVTSFAIVQTPLVLLYVPILLTSLFQN
ncbi:neural cell adhesion molecule 2 [Amyelois transitella]|uniref:neural cell adhesion molecule 2 n=1 Tax=Amyelois transitella TaxID=680683 RepID=UPI00298FF696|nr:neural cell adhesion molecule 2 [Amyelois transitella]